jgi:hypothetical protein
MTDLDLLTQWLQDAHDQLAKEIQALPPEALNWQPDPEANSIGVTVWHVARWMDILAVQVFQAKPAEAEVWHTQGWRAHTGYDPRGKGQKGWGAITGYTQAEVKAIPLLSAQELLMYLGQAYAALREQILGLPLEALHQRAPGLTYDMTLYDWAREEWQGFFGHVGEIQAIKAMWGRKNKED